MEFETILRAAVICWCIFTFLYYKCHVSAARLDRVTNFIAADYISPAEYHTRTRFFKNSSSEINSELQQTRKELADVGRPINDLIKLKRVIALQSNIILILDEQAWRKSTYIFA